MTLSVIGAGFGRTGIKQLTELVNTQRDLIDSLRKDVSALVSRLDEDNKPVK